MDKMNPDALEAQKLFEEIVAKETKEKEDALNVFQKVFQEEHNGKVKVAPHLEPFLLESETFLDALRNTIQKSEKQKVVLEEKELTGIKIEAIKRLQYLMDHDQLEDFDEELKRYQTWINSCKASENFSCFDASKDTVTTEDLKNEPVLFKPNFLTKGEIHILAGKAGSGKSYLATQLIYSLSTGKPLLGMPVAEKQKVAYLSFEDSRGRLLKRLRNIGWKDTKGFILYNDLSPLIICSGGKAEVTPIGHGILNSLILKDPDTIVIDTYSQAFLHEDGDNKASQAIGNWLKKEFGDKTILIIHHMRKAEEYNKRDEITIDAIRGASALVGYARSVFFLSGIDQHYHLKTLKSNYGEPFPDYASEMVLEKILDQEEGRQVFRGFRERENYISSARQKMEEVKI